MTDVHRMSSSFEQGGLQQAGDRVLLQPSDSTSSSQQQQGHHQDHHHHTHHPAGLESQRINERIPSVNTLFSRLMRLERRSTSRSTKTLPGSTPVWFTRTSSETPTSTFSRRTRPTPSGPHRLSSTTQRARRNLLQTRERSSASFLERISSTRGRTRRPPRTSTCSREARTT